MNKWLCSLLLMCGSAYAAIPLDPHTVTKYVDPLPIPGTYHPIFDNTYRIGMYPISQQLNRFLPPTPLWGYGTSARTATYPGRTFVVYKNHPINVIWKNKLPTTHLLSSSIDHTLDGLSIIPDVRNVVHLHGGDNSPANDGGPNDWFTPGNSVKYHYPNRHDAATLWYHDHALGITRLNVYAGLAGFYLIKDPKLEHKLNLPSGKYDIPIVIQDRSLNTDGTLNYPTVGINPNIHPEWVPEFFGDLIVVNGKTWPFLNVEPRKYRFRILNGSNARMYNLQFPTIPGQTPPKIYQIGTDGGYLPNPVVKTNIFIAPGERADVVVDFTCATGTSFTLINNAVTPFPNGALPDPTTTGQIMKFNIVPLKHRDRSSIPNNLVPAPVFPFPVTTRHLMLNEVQGPNGPVMVLMNNSKFDNPPTELPANGSTEVWEIANITADTHPIHTHLTTFHVINRQKFDVAGFQTAFDTTNPGILPGAGGTIPDVTPFLVGAPIPPLPEEAGTNDTIKMNPGEVTRIIITWKEGSGRPFPFDPTLGGYVYHCHILEHEDNDMMRPYKVTP